MNAQNKRTSARGAGQTGENPTDLSKGKLAQIVANLG